MFRKNLYLVALTIAVTLLGFLPVIAQNRDSADHVSAFRNMQESALKVGAECWRNVNNIIRIEKSLRESGNDLPEVEALRLELRESGENLAVRCYELDQYADALSKSVDKTIEDCSDCLAPSSCADGDLLRTCPFMVNETIRVLNQFNATQSEYGPALSEGRRLMKRAFNLTKGIKG